jgi:hypothetical protein
MPSDMADRWFYRNEAKMARHRASVTTDPIAGQTWLRIAEEYDNLADNVEAADRSEQAFGPAPSRQQPQPMQQQQAKKKEE